MVAAPHEEGLIYPGPFLAGEPGLGYDVIADADHNGHIWSMMQPGAEGQAIMAVSYQPRCLCGCYDGPVIAIEHPQWPSYMVPIHLPAIVKWRSLTTMDGPFVVPDGARVDDWLLTERHKADVNEQDYGEFGLPLVEITDAHLAIIEGVGWNSLSTGSMDSLFFAEMFEGRSFPEPGAMALTPAYNLLPIEDMEVADAIGQSIQTFDRMWPFNDCLRTDFEEEYMFGGVDDYVEIAEKYGHSRDCFLWPGFRTVDGDQGPEVGTSLTCEWNPSTREMDCGGTPHDHALLGTFGWTPDKRGLWKAEIPDPAYEPWMALMRQLIHANHIISREPYDERSTSWVHSFSSHWSPWPQFHPPAWPLPG